MRKNIEFLSPFVDAIAEALMLNVMRFEAGTRPIVRQNAAIAMGRLGLVAGSRLIETGIFARMFTEWCNTVKRLRTDGEKVSAMSGFLNCVQAAPRVAMTQDNLCCLHELIASVFPPPSLIEPTLKSVITLFRELLGQDAWNSMWSTLSIDVQYRLNLAYSLGQSVNPPPPPTGM